MECQRGVIEPAESPPTRRSRVKIVWTRPRLMRASAYDAPAAFAASSAFISSSLTAGSPGDGGSTRRDARSAASARDALSASAAAAAEVVRTKSRRLVVTVFPGQV